MEELYLSWQQVGALPGEQQVLLVLIPRAQVDAHMATLDAASLQPKLVGLKSMAVAAATTEPEAIIVNVEVSTLDIALVLNGILRTAQTLIQQQDGLPPPQLARRVATAVNRAIDFYNDNHVLEPVEPTTMLLLSGRVTTEPGFRETLAETSGYPVESIQPPLEYPPHFPVAEYAVNLDLALHEIPSAKEDGSATTIANLIPQRRKWYASRQLILGALGTLLGLVTLLYLVVQVLTPIQSDTDLWQQALDSRTIARQAAQLTNTRRTNLLDQITSYEQVGEQRGQASDLLFLMEDLLLPGMRINVMSYTEQGVDLQVSSPSFDDAEEYMEELRIQGIFVSVSSPEQRGAAGEGLEVTLSIRATLQE